MEIKIEYSDAYVRKVFVETGVVLKTKYVELDASELTPEDRKRLLAVSSGDYDERELNFYADDESEDVMKLVNDHCIACEAKRVEEERKRKAEEERLAKVKAQQTAWIEEHGSEYLRSLLHEGCRYVGRLEWEYDNWYAQVISKQTGMEWKNGCGSDYRDCDIFSKNDTPTGNVMEAYLKVKDIDGLYGFSFGCNGSYLRAKVRAEFVDDFSIYIRLE